MDSTDPAACPEEEHITQVFNAIDNGDIDTAATLYAEHWKEFAEGDVYDLLREAVIHNHVPLADMICDKGLCPMEALEEAVAEENDDDTELLLSPILLKYYSYSDLRSLVNTATEEHYGSKVSTLLIEAVETVPCVRTAKKIGAERVRSYLVGEYSFDGDLYERERALNEAVGYVISSIGNSASHAELVEMLKALYE